MNLQEIEQIINDFEQDLGSLMLERMVLHYKNQGPIPEWTTPLDFFMGFANWQDQKEGFQFWSVKHENFRPYFYSL